MRKLFTLGYQGLGIDQYAQILQQAGVTLVIDVRETPWSHKRDFVKNAFQSSLAEKGIGYLHLKTAGNPKAIRSAAKSTAECLSQYSSFLEENPTGRDDIARAILDAEKTNAQVCLTCFERNHTECHRSILASALLSVFPDLEIVNLGEEDENLPLFKTASSPALA